MHDLGNSTNPSVTETKVAVVENARWTPQSLTSDITTDINAPLPSWTIEITGKLLQGGDSYDKNLPGPVFTEFLERVELTVMGEPYESTLKPMCWSRSITPRNLVNGGMEETNGNAAATASTTSTNHKSSESNNNTRSGKVSFRSE